MNTKILFQKKILPTFFSPRIVLAALILIGLLLRTYNLDWGAPFYFHPDERNVISAVTALDVTQSLNPHFFAYGSAPLYIIYFLGVIFSFIKDGTITPIVAFSDAIIIGRVLSTFFSIGTILLLYKTALLFVSRRAAMFCAFFATFSVGFIQYAHFGTFESYLTFFSLLLFYLCVQYITRKSFLYFIYACIIVGVLVSLKISSLVLFPIPLFVALILYKKTFISASFSKKLLLLLKALGIGLIEILIILVTFLLLNPYAVIDFQAFASSIQYESAVGTGSLPVFYTGTFYNTLPFWYHATKIFPFLLTPILWIVFLTSIPILIKKTYFKKDIKLFFLLLFFLFLSIPQAVLFVKWTRYMILTLPFIYILLCCAGEYLYKAIPKKHTKILFSYTVFVCLLVILSITHSLIFIRTVYVQKDTRILAAEFAINALPKSSKILSEVYDLGIIPFNDHFPIITLFDFYALDIDPLKKSELPDVLSQHDYFIVLSQRIQKSRLQNPENFPVGYAFYSQVFEETNFTLVYSTPCDIWCKILYIGDPMYGVEDTANVFDRPQVSIYKIE